MSGVWMYHIVEREGPVFRVVREDGVGVASRRRLAHAQEVVDCLMDDERYPTEARQVIRDLKALSVSYLPDDVKNRPWAVVDSRGVVVRRFIYEFRARWWLERYDAEREKELQDGQAGPEKDAE